MREVTRTEFYDYIKKRPYLERNVNRIVEPARLEYYDFRHEDDKWPDKMVAYIKTDYLTGLPKEYFIE